MLTWPLTLALFLGALLLHLEIVRRDLEAPKPPDPYRQDRIKGGESLDPDSEVSLNPRFPDRDAGRAKTKVNRGGKET